MVFKTVVGLRTLARFHADRHRHSLASLVERRLVRRLEALGYTVSLQPAA